MLILCSFSKSGVDLTMACKGHIFDACCELSPNNIILGLNKCLKADFGELLPVLSLLATIAFAYSVISPIINGIALISMCFNCLAFYVN
jgi:hypothetical protein